MHLYVVYFYQLLGTACTQKLVKTFFSAVFQPFLIISHLFSDFTAEIKKKCVFVYSSKLVALQKLVDSLRGYPEIVFFGLIFYFMFWVSSISLYLDILCYGLKWSKKVEKRLKKCFNQLWGARSTQKLVEMHKGRLKQCNVNLNVNVILLFLSYLSVWCRDFKQM